VKVVVLSGGVGGARFVQGLVEAVEPSDITVIGNVGDDVEVLGLHVSPDLDSILYALAGLNDEERGWGRADETWRALETVGELGGENWFQLGDLDLGLHLVRTQALRSGEPLSSITGRLAAALGIETHVLPATDDRLRTWIETPAGEFPFQEWFVARGHRDEVDAVRFEGEAAPAPGALDALERAELLLSRRATRACRSGRSCGRGDPRSARGAPSPCSGVSPLIGGRAVKGPADRMLARLAGGTSPAHVAAQYAGLIDALVVDEADAHDLDGLAEARPIVTRTLMTDTDARKRLAEAALGAVPA
jgi:LPPG:FO 2-phospho-L-lactate transferase